MGIFTSHSHLSPHMAILTLHGHFHLTWPFVTLCGHFHLMWLFLTSSGHFHLTLPFFTLHGHSHLAWAFSLCVAISHLAWPFTPCMYPHLVHSLPWHQKSSCMHPKMREQISHLTCILHAPLHAKIILFTLHGKHSQKITKQPQFHQ